jgi:hypothetical protein
MGAMKDDNVKPQDVDFFKIDEATYDPKTRTWGSDWLVQNHNISTVTILSDIKPGMYIVRHETVALHSAWRDTDAKVSGAQFYPQCVKLQVTGDGTATPPGVRFPGGYVWNEPGVLENIYYTVNRYVSPLTSIKLPSLVLAIATDALN